MLTRPESSDRVDILADVAVAIVAEEGTAAISVSSLVRRMGHTPQALINRFRHRRRVIELVLLTVAARWSMTVSGAWTSGVQHEPEQTVQGLTRMLAPWDDVTELGIWLAFLEMARGSKDHASLVTQVRREERRMVEISLTRLQGVQPSGAAVSVVQALVDGLRLQLIDPTEPISLSDASKALAGAVAAWCPPTVERPHRVLRPTEPLSAAVN